MLKLHAMRIPGMAGAWFREKIFALFEDAASEEEDTFKNA